VKITTLLRGEDGFPERLAAMKTKCPSTICVGGHFTFHKTIAIVGSRRPTDEGRAFARDLAAQCAGAGAIVVSGGAPGIDEAAHVGAWEANGATWVIWPNGSASPLPADRVDFAARARAQGKDNVTFVWPFDPSAKVESHRYLARNGVLAALAEVVVIVEARLASGTLNTFGWAKKLERDVWVVPLAPWAENSAGSLAMLEAGAKPLADISRFLQTVGLRPAPPATGRAHAQTALVLADPTTRQVFDQVGRAPTHVDFIVEKSRLTTSTVATTLLTLALEHVLVEGPPGHYRRA
jgi:DNA processing protein